MTGFYFLINANIRCHECSAIRGPNDPEVKTLTSLSLLFYQLWYGKEHLRKISFKKKQLCFSHKFFFFLKSKSRL